MTDAEPTPVFRRFPWVQFVFCVACLAMCGYTWMRYSYAWSVMPADFGCLPWKTESPYASTATTDWSRVETHPLVGRYVALTGIPSWPGSGSPWLDMESPSDRKTVVRVHLRPSGTLPPLDGSPVTVKGRVTSPSPWIFIEDDFPRAFVVRADASRLHGASIAGLVVGGMGCFIFGLYLRRWLREREALAGEPLHDRIV